VKDPLGTLISELRDANLAGKRVRSKPFIDSADPTNSDVQDAGHYRRFVILTVLGYSRWPRGRLPMQRVRVGARCYGATEQDAAALYGELSDLIDNRGPRLSAAGVAIYQSLDEVGGQAELDPDTDQPYCSGVIELLAGTDVLGS
jgi:hypothetical protein